MDVHTQRCGNDIRFISKDEQLQIARQCLTVPDAFNGVVDFQTHSSRGIILLDKLSNAAAHLCQVPCISINIGLNFAPHYGKHPASLSRKFYIPCAWSDAAAARHIEWIAMIILRHDHFTSLPMTTLSQRPQTFSLLPQPKNIKTLVTWCRQQGNGECRGLLLNGTSVQESFNLHCGVGDTYTLIVKYGIRAAGLDALSPAERGEAISACKLLTNGFFDAPAANEANKWIVFWQDPTNGAFPCVRLPPAKPEIVISPITNDWQLSETPVEFTNHTIVVIIHQDNGIDSNSGTDVRVIVSRPTTEDSMYSISAVWASDPMCGHYTTPCTCGSVYAFFQTTVGRTYVTYAAIRKTGAMTIIQVRDNGQIFSAGMLAAPGKFDRLVIADPHSTNERYWVAAVFFFLGGRKIDSRIVKADVFAKEWQMRELSYAENVGYEPYANVIHAGRISTASRMARGSSLIAHHTQYDEKTPLDAMIHTHITNTSKNNTLKTGMRFFDALIKQELASAQMKMLWWRSQLSCTLIPGPSQVGGSLIMWILLIATRIAAAYNIDFEITSKIFWHAHLNDAYPTSYKFIKDILEMSKRWPEVFRSLQL